MKLSIPTKANIIFVLIMLIPFSFILWFINGCFNDYHTQPNAGEIWYYLDGDKDNPFVKSKTNYKTVLKVSNEYVLFVSGDETNSLSKFYFFRLYDKLNTNYVPMRREQWKLGTNN